jgi:xanthine dehydrogenase accessory factor
MRDAKHLLATAALLQATQQRFLVATVVRTQGSSYRPAGARMLMTEHHRAFGTVSGGCLEQRLLRTGFWQTDNGPVLVTMDSSDPDEPDAVLGCGGIVEILLERDDTAYEALRFAADVIAQRGRGVMATVFVVDKSQPWRIGKRWMFTENALDTFASLDSPAWLLAACRSLLQQEPANQLDCQVVQHHGVHCLIEPVYPPIDLLVFGTGFDAQPLVASAARLGWNVEMWNPTGRFDVATRFANVPRVHASLSNMMDCIATSPQAYAVVMGHDKRHDQAALEMLLASRVQYIGVLGPRHRTHELNDCALADPRVYAPIGIDIHADSAEEIALAVTAEILATSRAASGQSLRHRPFIHGRAQR